MKVLIVSFAPIESNNSATIRTLGLVKGLLQLNCAVDYLTVKPNSNTLAQVKYEFSKKIRIIRVDNNRVYDIVVRNEDGPKKIIVQTIRKVYHAFSIYDHTYSIAKKVDISLLTNTQYDLVISSSDPKTSHIAVKSLIKQGLKYRNWIQYWGDPMALDITNKSIYPRRFLAKHEERLLKLADRIIYVSPFTLSQQKELFKNLSNKMYFLPVPYIEERVYERVSNNKLVMGYFGSYHSNVRNIIPLYNACLKLKDCVQLYIVGDSDLKLKEAENIKIYPRGDISEFEKHADLLVCLLNRKGTQIPAKVYHAAATNKPVLVILDGQEIEAFRKYFESFNRFILCENNEKSIQETTKSIIMNKDTLEYQPAPEFHPNRIAKSFIELAQEK